MNSRMARLTAEVLALASRFGKVRWDDKSGMWVIVEKYPLPRGFSKGHSAVLVDVPSQYPEIAPTEGCYLDRDLTLAGGARIPHFLTDSDMNKYRNNNWGYFCFHHQQWRPVASIWGGDNLVGFFEGIALKLQEVMR